MTNVTRLPPISTTVRVAAEIPVSQRDEFERAMIDIVAGEKPRMGVTHALRGWPLTARERTARDGQVRGDDRRVLGAHFGISNDGTRVIAFLVPSQKIGTVGYLFGESLRR